MMIDERAICIVAKQCLHQAFVINWDNGSHTFRMRDDKQSLTQRYIIN